MFNAFETAQSVKYVKRAGKQGVWYTVAYFSNIIWVVFDTGGWLMISLGILPTNIFQIITIHEGGIPINQPV